MKKKLFITTVALIAITNIIMNLYSDNKIADLTSLKMEAFANSGESTSGAQGPLIHYGCAITINEIIGHESNGAPIIRPTVYSGEAGQCVGQSGACSPFSCTKIAGI